MAGTDIVVVGSINTDHVISVVRHPSPGETVAGRGLRSFPGGKGANQAVAAARWSARVRVLGAVGADASGEAALANLAAAGVDGDGVTRLEGAATGQAFICVADGGENTIVVAGGANAEFGPERLKAGALGRAAVVLCQLEIPQATVEAALSAARAAGALALLNAAPCEPWARALLPLCDVLIVNESELALLGGGDGSDLAASATCLALRPDQTLVVTLGARGVAAFHAGERLRVAGRTVEVIDTTGAGDCFCGALAALLAEGAGLLRALTLANLAASLSVGQAGAQSGMLTRAAVEAGLQASGED